MIAAWLLAATVATQTWSVEPGIDLVLVEDHRAAQVTVVVEFPVGRFAPWAHANDAEEAFEFQLYDPDGKLRARADELAADISPWVGTHASFLRATCLREDLEEVMQLVRDVLGNPTYDRRRLTRRNREQSITWKGSLKDPEFRLFREAARRFHDADDPRRREWEKPEAVDKDTQRLVAVRDTIVRLPGRVIGFAGDVDRATATRLARGLLPPVLDQAPAGTALRLPPLRSPDDGATLEMARVTQGFFLLSRGSPAREDPRFPAFLVADHALGGHFFSRLYDALRHEGGETYGAFTVGNSGVYAQVYGLFTFTRAGNTDPTRAKLHEVLRRFHEDGITEDEREFAVGYLLGRRPFEKQSPGQILSRHLQERRHGLPPGFLDALPDRAAATSLEEVNAFIREFYDPAAFTWIEVRPR